MINSKASWNRNGQLLLLRLIRSLGFIYIYDRQDLGVKDHNMRTFARN